MNYMHNFAHQKQQAINQMNEMQKRAKLPQEKPDINKIVEPKINKCSKSVTPKSLISLSDDSLVILALILILYSENSDILLMLALAYILM